MPIYASLLKKNYLVSDSFSYNSRKLTKYLIEHMEQTID